MVLGTVVETASREHCRNAAALNGSLDAGASARVPAFGGLLLAHTETARRELDDWATQLLRALAERRRWPVHSAPYAERLIGSTNAAALLEAHRGDLAAAESICLRQLAFLARHPQRSTLDIARHAVNPWLNLGRVASLRGDHARALAQFAAFGPAAGARIGLAGVVLRRRALNEQLRNELGIRDFAGQVYVVNSLRALVRAGRAQPLRAFCEGLAESRLVRDGSSEQLVLAESGIVAAQMAGEREAAQALALGWRDRTRGLARWVFTARAIEMEPPAGPRTQAAAGALLREAKAQVLPGLAAGDVGLPTIATAVHLGKLARALGRIGVARDLARAAYGAALNAHDVLLQSASLSLRIQLDAGDRGVARALAALKAGSGYVAVRGAPAGRSEAMSVLHEATFSALG